MKKTGAFVRCAAVASTAILLGYIESLLPPILPVAGIKIGLANIAVVFAMYTLGNKSAWAVSLIKVFLCAMLFNGFTPFLYSLSGAVLSMLAQTAAKRMKVFSIIGVSAVGGLFHNAGQLICAWLIIGKGIVFYIPVLAFSGILGGAITGFLAKLMIMKGGRAFGEK